VLTTDQEHGGCLAVGLRWQAAGVVSSVETVAVPYGVYATFGSASRTPLVFASHVLTTTGLHLPLKQVAALVHKHGALLVVDGA
jgi:selenocysteine lyase/cysteine desulfurase